MTVSALTPGSAAERAGLQTGDTILELNGKTVGQESTQELARIAPGDTNALKVRGRRSGDREMKWKVGSREEISYELKDVEHVNEEQEGDYAEPRG